MALDLCNRWEGDLNDLPVRAEHLDAWRGERLRGFHTANCTPYSSAISSNDFNVVFPVERL